MQAAVLPGGHSTGVLRPLERIAGTKALIVPEILIIILSFASRSTLASAARVSKAWSPIALDQLWSGHDVKVLDLLQVLPISHMQDLHSPQRTWDLVHDPTEEEWARFRSYASRVRSLVFPRQAPDYFDSRITEWKVEKEALFPRLRKIEACFIGLHAQPFSPLLQFITPGLREFYLNPGMFGPGLQSFLDVLATSEGLHLQKLKLCHSSSDADMALAGAVVNLAVANAGSMEALELPYLRLNPSLITGHSFLNLRALSFFAELLEGGGDKHPIQVLVEGCPHVAYLRIELEPMWSYPPTNILDVPGLRMILNWHLVSLEVQPEAPLHLTKASLEEMGKAWPKLKRLNLRGVFLRLPFSRLADILSAFPQLEDLGAFLYYEEEEETFLATYQLSPEHRRRPSRLRKLRLGGSRPPRSESERDLVARLLARVLPPGLRISFGSDPQVTLSPAELAERERALEPNRDLGPKWNIGPEWDVLLRQIEQIHGGVQFWVGPILDNSDGVWF